MTAKQLLLTGNQGLRSNLSVLVHPAFGLFTRSFIRAPLFPERQLCARLF